MKRHRSYTIITTGAVAAAIAIVAWISVANAAKASAAIVLEQVKQALGGRMSMTLTDIDMGNILVSGEIILDHDPARPDPESDRLYSELHVLMRPETEGWNAIEAVNVICQSPGESWRYCRGNGGTVGFMSKLFNQKHVSPSDYFVSGGRWDDFKSDPLGDFGAMPCSMSYSYGDSVGRYSFGAIQRKYLERLMNFLLTLGDPTTAEPILDQLREGLTDKRTSVDPNADIVLSIHDFRDFGPLQLTLQQDPPLDTVLINQAFDLDIDIPTGTYRGMSAANIANLSLNAYGVSQDTSQLYDVKLPQGSADAIVAALKVAYLNVEVLDVSNSTLKVRLIAPDLPLIDDGRDWMTNTLPDLLAQMSLEIHYDGGERRVTKAEFNHVGCEEGRIRIKFGKPALDQAKLDPARWGGAAAENLKAQD